MGRLRPRLIRTRLALGFLAIIVTAVGAIYLYVVPQLESRLRDERLGSLAAHAQTYSGALARAVGTPVTAGQVARRVRQAAQASGGRVTLLRVGRMGTEPLPSVAADSSVPPMRDDLSFPAALDAVNTNAPATGTEASSQGRIGEAAVPLRLDGRVVEVVVYSQPLTDVVGTVAVVRRQVLVAGGVAIVLAALAGFLIARAPTRRVKRLERAADQVAAGNFRPIPVESDDELGQLTRAFNDMQRQLVQLDSARKQFIATASHELRTPIFSLGGFVELLEDEDLDEETRHRFLGQVREQVERLRKLSVDLLDLSRLEAGSFELHPEPVDLADVARSVSDEFEPALAQHDSNLELRLARQPTEALCDPVRVAQIMRILIDNALTHTPPGTDIVVSAGRENGRMRLAVRDLGAGIDPTALEHIFEPFYTSNDARGSGLGLTIASELAELMAGRLGVDSRPGRTVFTLEIPA